MNEKSCTYWIKLYWLGAMTQMLVVCVALFSLRLFKIAYPPFLNLVFLAIGGTSSAVWGVIVSKKSNRVNTYKEIFFDFFAVKQPIRYYGLTLIFLTILFGVSIFTGKTLEGVMWYTFPICFIQAIVFGGIEEIGWRYTFQPLLEKKMPYEAASIMTLLSWGLWHYLYFYITDSISNIEHVTFLLGLAVSCFVLGAIYRLTHSLWLCVLYHCLLNTFSQTLEPNGKVWGIMSSVICILLAIAVVRKQEIKEQHRYGSDRT